jgi:hypothetical protein
MRDPGVDDDGVGRSIGAECKAVGCYDRRGQAAARLSLTWAARAGSISIALNATRAANNQIAGCIFD